jgi:hypothetical protein
MVDREAWRKAGAAGFLWPWLDEKWGGPGADFLCSVIVMEELARAYESGFAMALHSDIIVPYVACFRADDRKLIVYTGGADPVFSANYHLKWYRRLVAENDGLERTRQFARLFVVPGMNHCGGGPSTSQFDAFASLVDWVENGKAPDSILATAPAGTPWPGRTRPLCPYPDIARYRGAGDINVAASFECRSDDRHHHHKPGHDDD